MPLFSNDYQPASNPYYANFEDSPEGIKYAKKKKELETNKTAVQATTGVVGGVLSAIFPFLTPLFTTGQKIGNDVGDRDVANREQKAYDKGFAQYQNKNPLGTRNNLSSFSDYWNSKDTNQISTLLSSILKQQPQENSLNKISPAGGGGSGITPYGQNSLPTQDNLSLLGDIQNPYADQTFTDPNSPTVGGDLGAGQYYDFSSNSAMDIAPADGTVGMKKGGMIAYKGGGLLKPVGEDDIALIDTKDQKDTGVRVQKGEMLVVSKDTLASLQKALKKGDHKKVYNLMKSQVEQAPKVEDGNEGFAKGGTANIDETFDKELEALNKKIKAFEQWATAESLGKNLDGLTKKNLDKLQSLKTQIEELKNGYARQSKVLPNQDKEHLSGLAERQLATLRNIGKEVGDATNTEEWSGYATTEKLKPTGSDENLPREKPVPPGIDQFKAGGYDTGEPDLGQTTKPATYEELGVPPVATPAEYPLNLDQPEAAVPQSADWKKYARFYAPEAIGTGYDIFRAVTGMQAANTHLPKFQKGAAWGDYLNRLHQLSESGLTGNELSSAQRDIDSSYAYDVANVRNLSGGQSGLALGNLGRAASSHYKSLADLTALNDEARARNLGQYGGALTQDINLNRMIFGDRYNEALWTKDAGSRLANDAFKNIGERGNYIQSYAPNSYYGQLMDSELKKKAEQERYAKLANDYYAKNGFSAPAVGSSNLGV